MSFLHCNRNEILMQLQAKLVHFSFSSSNADVQNINLSGHHVLSLMSELMQKHKLCASLK